jgi:glyoxylase-like metal-dependent hydrolase (beta-lactamase superfamily II)
MNEESARTTSLGNGITAVDTDYVRPLLDASHLLVEEGRAAFVDTGTNHSVQFLLQALAKQGLDTGDVDFVFLTHVHLDHAGGAGLLMRALPNARAVIHPRGARHMIDPAKLIAGAQLVYGRDTYASMYGEIIAIPEQRVIVADDGQEFSLAGRKLRCFFTEGHARHHYCLHDPASHGVFTGDSFGVSYREFDTAAGEFIFPTTTPVHFDPDEAHRSVDLVMARDPQQLFLTHYSRVTDLSRLAGDMHRGIVDFAGIAQRNIAVANRSAVIRDEMFEYLAERLQKHGSTADDARLHAILDMDTELNTMGLEHWLDHGSPS